MWKGGDTRPDPISQKGYQEGYPKKE